MNTAQFILAIIAALGGISGLAVALLSRKKLAAETEGTMVKAAKDVVNIAMDQLAVLEKELKRLNTLVEDYRAQILVAAQQAETQVKQTASLGRRVTALEDVLAQHDIPFPPWVNGGGEK